MQSQVRFNRVPKKVPGSLGAEPRQVQQDSGECSGEGSRKPWCRARLGSTGFRRRRFQRRPGRLWCRARSSSTGFRRRFRRSGRLWCRARSSSTGFRRRFRRRSGRLWCKAKSGSTGSGEGCRGGPGEGFGNLWCGARSGSTGSGEGCREGSGEVCFSSFCFHACAHGIHGCH